MRSCYPRARSRCPIDTFAHPASATLGTAIYDTARLIGGNDPTGYITFNLYNNSNDFGGSIYEYPFGNLLFGASSSGLYTPAAIGTYYWVVTYDGDSNNSPLSSGSAAEPVVITAPSPVAAPEPSSLTLVALALVGLIAARRRLWPTAHRRREDGAK